MKKQKRRRYFVVLFVFLWLFYGGTEIFLSLSGIQEAQAAAPVGAWWDNNYTSRQKITVNAGRGVKSVQTGTTTIANGNPSATATITSVDTTKAFLVFGISGTLADPVNGQVSGQITNSTTLTFQRVGTSLAITVKWYVAEFTSGVSVQRGSQLFTVSDTVINVPINSVNTAKSFPIISFRTGGAAYSSNDFVKAKITPSTNLQLALAGTGDASNNNYVEWQVIEYTDANVQTGDVSFLTTDGSKTAPLTSVNLSKSWLVYTYNSVDGTGTNIGQKLVRGLITNATTLTFDRNNTGQTMNLTWYLVEFTDGTTVQQNSESFLTTETQRNVTITSVATTRSIAVGGYFCRGGRSNYSTDDNPGVGWFTFDLTTATNLAITRGLTGTSTADVGWFVLEFPPDQAAVPNGYSVSLTFDHAALVAGGKSLANGNDIRVVYWNGSTWVQLNRTLDPLSSWNNVSTKIWFKLQAGISAGGSDDNYYLYYRNPSAVNPPADWAGVFRVGDDFNNGTLTSELTTSTSGTASITETGGELFIDLGTNELTDAGMLVTTNSLLSDKKYSIRHKTKLVSGGGISDPEVKAIGIYQLNTRPGVAPSATENPRRRINAFHRVAGDAWIIYNPSGAAYSWNGTAWVSGWLSWGTLSLDTYYIYDLISNGTSWYVKVSDANGNLITATTPVLWSSVQDTGDPLWFYWGEPYTDYYYADQKSDWVYVRDYVSPEPTTSLSNAESRFDYRRQITILDSMTPLPPTCTSNLSNFPVLISLSGNWLKTKANGGDIYHSQGYDIVFRTSDGETKLDHEIEKYDGGATGGTLAAWVRIPTLYYNQDTIIYIYYGNAEITTSTANPNGVWNSNYMGVWHLADTSGNTLDSTSYNISGTVSGTVTRGATGQINGAFDFSTNGWVNWGDPVDGHLDFGTGSFTVSAWINMDTNQPGGSPQIIWKGNNGAVADTGYALEFKSADDTLCFIILDGNEQYGHPSLDSHRGG